MESREDKSLFQNHVFTFKISRFTIFIFLLIILWFFIKIISFSSKIGPLWAHKGPYGPIRALWAHMGPNPGRAPTRAGPQPGQGPNPDRAPTRTGPQPGPGPKLDQNSSFSHVRTLSWLHKLRNTQGKIPPCTWNISRKHIWNISGLYKEYP